MSSAAPQSQYGHFLVSLIPCLDNGQAADAIQYIVRQGGNYLPFETLIDVGDRLPEELRAQVAAWAIDTSKQGNNGINPVWSQALPYLASFAAGMSPAEIELVMPKVLPIYEGVYAADGNQRIVQEKNFLRFASGLGKPATQTFAKILMDMSESGRAIEFDLAGRMLAVMIPKLPDEDVKRCLRCVDLEQKKNFSRSMIGSAAIYTKLGLWASLDPGLAWVVGSGGAEESISPVGGGSIHPDEAIPGWGDDFAITVIRALPQEIIKLKASEFMKALKEGSPLTEENLEILPFACRMMTYFDRETRDIVFRLLLECFGKEQPVEPYQYEMLCISLRGALSDLPAEEAREVRLKIATLIATTEDTGRLAALCGLLAPADDPSDPRLLDLVPRMLENPLLDWQLEPIILNIPGKAADRRFNRQQYISWRFPTQGKPLHR